MTPFISNEKSKKKREKRSCLRTLSYFVVAGLLCSVVMCLVLAVLGPTIGNIFFQPEIIYVQPDFAIDIQPIDVTYHQPDLPGQGGIFENSLYFRVDSQTTDVTIENGTATVNHTLTIINADSEPVEGVFIVPLPSEEAFESLSVFISGKQGAIVTFTAEEGRTYLQSLAQEHNDFSLLAYSDRPFIETDVFPLRGTQTVTVSYTYALDSINGLAVLDIPLAFPVTVEHPVGQLNININVSDELPLRNIYPATLDLAITQTEPAAFTASANLAGYLPPQDLELYYAPSNAEITANVITYRENSAEDGYFLLLAEPAPVADEQIVAKDVMLVLDQSGSMSGVKWQQAQDAAVYVLEHLNRGDRFFVTTFSSSHTLFDNTLLSAASAPDAMTWVRTQSSGGGTNINDALLQTLSFADSERPTTLLFMTDGQATEGITDTQAILENLRGAVGENVRIFVFGVGDDVNTTLLDSIAREYRGETGYVRQNESIDTEISALYTKVSSPILTNIQVDFGDAVAGNFVPAGQLPDLYAGQQLILAGRYRHGADNITLTLTGTANGATQTYTFENLAFQDERSGKPFVAQLWAARLAGETLNTVRLGNEDPELVNSIVSLSLRYGIVTPYTQFLYEQDDVLSSAGQQEANVQMMQNAANLQQNQTGATAVAAADMLNGLSSSRNYVPTFSFGSSSSGYYSRQQFVTITPTPLPPFAQNGLLLTITQESDPSSNGTTVSGEAVQYVLSLNEAAFNRAIFVLPDAITVASPAELPILISDLINTYGIERGIEIYNEAFGPYLPLLPVETALVDGVYEVAPLPVALPPMRNIQEKTFILQEGIYTDTTFTPDTMQPVTMTVGSDEYSAFISSHPDALPYLAVGTPLIIVWDGTAYTFE